MRNNLEVGDEITTIGGIFGVIVKIKEETVTIETGKDRTKIRILRSAVRVVDVHAYEKRGDGKKPVEPVVEDNSKIKKVKTKDLVVEPSSPVIEEAPVVKTDDNNAPKRKRGKKKNSSSQATEQITEEVENDTAVIDEVADAETVNNAEASEQAPETAE